MIYELRVLYINNSKEPIISFETIETLFDIEFDEKIVEKTKGINADKFLQYLQNMGWKINIKRDESDIKVILTREKLC